MKVVQAFHTVHTILYMGFSDPGVGSLTATYWFYLDTRLLARTPHIQNYAYSIYRTMRTVITFKMLCPQVSNFVHIKGPRNDYAVRVQWFSSVYMHQSNVSQTFFRHGISKVCVQPPKAAERPFSR